MLALAAAGSMLIWVISEQSQSPYVTAKALVIASPLLLAVAVFPLVERGPRRPPWWTIAPLLALVLMVRVGLSDARALRISPIGPTDHLAELRPLRPLLASRPTLFLGNDDFIKSELAGVPVDTVVAGDAVNLPMRSEKVWTPGQPVDFDSVEAPILNRYKWFVTTRDAAASAPPPQLKLVRSTDSYAVWRRTGRVRERSVLTEGEMPGQVLNCRARRGRAVVQGGGVAAVRPKPVATPAAPVLPGSTTTNRLLLHPGKWDLSVSYTSTFPVDVGVRGLQTMLPANLEQCLWPVRRLVPRCGVIAPSRRRRTPARMC
jgi:hypothetical protein